MNNFQDRFKSKRIPWTRDELIITLAYYYFIYRKNTSSDDYEKFAENLRKMTGNERTKGSVGMRFANFVSVDPEKESGGFHGGDPVCRPLWHEFINNDGTPTRELIENFYCFIQAYGLDNIEIYYEFLISDWLTEKEKKKYENITKKEVLKSKENVFENLKKNTIFDENEAKNHTDKEKKLFSNFYS